MVSLDKKIKEFREYLISSIKEKLGDNKSLNGLNILLEGDEHPEVVHKIIIDDNDDIHFISYVDDVKTETSFSVELYSIDEIIEILSKLK